ncbi:hypothetical protein P8452_59076 [Trifolium repens]|nr:hypothetical protein P8452_59076 [Trifolium repens]
MLANQVTTDQHFLESFKSHFLESFESNAIAQQVVEDMNWVQRKVHLYNVTFGLYMLDWWERCSFNILVIVLMCFVVRYITRFFKRYILCII